MAIAPNTARRNTVLGGLDDDDLAPLLPDLDQTPLPLGQVLHEPGEPVTTVYFPLVGVVSVVTDLGEDQVVETATVGREGMVGLSVFLGAATPTERSLVQVAGRALTMSAEVLHQHTADVDGPLTARLRLVAQAMFTQLARNSACNRVHPVRQRAARWLLMTADRMDAPHFELTQAPPRPDARGAADLGERGGPVPRRGRLHHLHPRRHHHHRPGAAAGPCLRLLPGDQACHRDDDGGPVDRAVHRAVTRTDTDRDVSSREAGSPGTESLRSLLDACHLLAPEDLPGTVADRCVELGARETVLYLADYEQATLVPVPGAGVPERSALPIEGTLAGRAFQRVELVGSAGQHGYRLWIPLLDGVERLGVAELLLPEEPTGEQRDLLWAFLTLAAELIVVRDAYSDVFSRLRRRRPLSLAAEMQWELLPPMSFGTDRVVITGGLEPAYDIGGDSFDYAVNGDTAELLVLDAVGHGLPAAVLATVAVGAYRHARRNGLDLPDIAAEIDTAIAGQIGGSQFATAVLVRLDLRTGRLRWINAGHPEPLILRGTSLVRPPRCQPARPLGLQGGKPAACETRLEPGDRLLLYTDGITEARSPDGEFFGEQRLADFISAAVSAGQPSPETVRRLMRHVLDHQNDHLQDDASIVVLEWLTGAPRRVVP